MYCARPLQNINYTCTHEDIHAVHQLPYVLWYDANVASTQIPYRINGTFSPRIIFVDLFLTAKFMLAKFFQVRAYVQARNHKMSLIPILEILRCKNLALYGTCMHVTYCRQSQPGGEGWPLETVVLRYWFYISVVSHILNSSL